MPARNPSLDLRKSYHQLNHQIIQANHHKDFLEKCLTENVIPGGLRINLEPQAFMSSKSNIKDKWDQTTASMSKILIQLLVDHYLTVALDHKRQTRNITFFPLPTGTRPPQSFYACLPCM